MATQPRPRLKSASHPATNDKAFALITERLDLDSQVLDLGAGRGHLARRVGEWFEANGADVESRLTATDLDETAFEAKEVPFRRIDFNRPLPFPDNVFDVVYSIEVTEHLHSPYDFLKECFRVLKPEGFLVVSTPNILNLQSRLRFFFTGFWELYEPPSTDPANGGRICGHVMPLHLAYYAYGLRLAGFEEVIYESDRSKRGARALRFCLGPLLYFMKGRFERSVLAYDRSVYAENEAILSLVNGRQFMTARSLMFVARKP